MSFWSEIDIWVAPTDNWQIDENKKDWIFCNLPCQTLSIIICKKLVHQRPSIRPICLSDVRLTKMICSRRCAEDEALMAAILGGRKRGFLLEIVEKTEKGDSGGSGGGCTYPGWKRVLTKMASLQELRESLQGLSTACTDISSDKVASWIQEKYFNILTTTTPASIGCNDLSWWLPLNHPLFMVQTKSA